MMKKTNVVNIKDKKLKIAMIGHKRIPSREGGVEIVVEEISTRLVNLGHDVTAYNRKGHHVSGKEFDDNQKVNNLENYKGIKIVAVPTIEKRGLAAVTSSLFGTLKAILGKYDCIHYHAEGPCAMLWIPHFLGIRTVATIHGLDWQRAKWGGFATKYLKFGEKVAAKYADEVIVLSDNVKKYFKDTYNRETRFISNGISEPILKEVDLIKEKWNLEKDGYILYLGRIVPEKGIQYLIDAFKEVKTDKKLVIAGGASDTDDFMKEIKEKAAGDERIIFTGFVQGQTLQELYSNSYIYVLPSDLEGMPISLLEAMSYGNCCVVSDIPECSEVVEDKGVIFEKSNVSSLKQELENLCMNPKKTQGYKDSAKDFILKRYNWDKIVEETVNSYR
ncbi:glycosyltransferase family 4 protein [Clostridium culturomicium]|uniref:glycosyltransferase family 4 protein n=1 Tax=Clostridium culturomicium TaxID=1499683 RepID=UPI0038572A8F